MFRSVLVAFLLLSFHAQADDFLKITRITPQGEDVETTKQIVIEFDQAVVPVGRMDRTKEEIPVTIKPDVNCQWRWLNPTSLACNLDQKDALIPATKYSITIARGIKTQDGKTIEKDYKTSFITERPYVQQVDFTTWKSPGTPVLRIVVNQPVTKEELSKHLVLSPVEGKVQSFSVSVDEKMQKFPDMIKLPGESDFIIFDASKSAKSDDEKIETNNIEARRIWLITPDKELPKNSEIILNAKEGLVSTSGDQAGIQKGEIVKFYTYPDFEFVGIKCFTNDKNELILITDKDNINERCNPLGAFTLAFSTPVLRSIVKDNVVFDPPLNGGRTDYNPWGEENKDFSVLDSPHKPENLYQVYIPQGLKANKTYTVTIPQSALSKDHFADEFGNTLSKPVKLTFRTDHRKPNFEMVYRDAVLEKETDSEVPLYVTNLDKISFAYRAVSDKTSLDQTLEQTIPDVKNLQFAIPLGIRDMLKGKSGAVFGVLSTTPDINDRQYDKRLFAQVTPFQVHVKLGHYNSMAWVTDMKTGKPVKGAKLRIYTQSMDTLAMPDKVKAEAVSDENGIAVLPGSETLDPTLAYDSSWKDDQTILFARVDKDDDMAILPLSSSFTINSWRVAPNGVNDWSRHQYGHITSWGMTAQGIYRAGDTMQYKIYVRKNDNEKLVLPPLASYSLTITDPTGKIVDTKENIKLSSFGAYAGEFKISEQASVGWYQFNLMGYFDGKKKLKSKKKQKTADLDVYPLRVLVSDFTPAPFRVSTTINGDLFHAEQDINIDTSAKLHSGGAYTDASSRVTVSLESMPFSSQNDLVSGFQFDSFENEASTQQLYQSIQNIDNKGERHDTVKIPQQNIVYGKLTVESAVQDDRGKYTAGQAKADYVGVDRLVGLKSTEWVYTAGKDAKILYAVVDDHGNPVKGTDVDLLIERKETVAARVKGAGNAYLTDLTTSWKKEDSCKGKSEKEPSECEFTPEMAGTYRVTASIKDSKGKPHTTKQELWVTGDDYVQWDDATDSYLTIIPEKQDYKVGDTARYLVKNPYPGAEALITIERFGVIDHFVQKLDSSTSVIEFPIKPDYVPGFYLSIVVFSPRVDKPIDANQVDLGKPAFRIGYVTVPVKDPVKAINVAVKTDKDVYRPGDQVHVDLQATLQSPLKEKQPIEIAISVLDESVFDLVAGGKTAFDPYQGFYNLEPLDLRNYSLLTRLVGRQKFEKKGANPGGDGGNDLSMRNVFKYVSYWNATVMADEHGKVSVDFKVPDNLTGWRVLAVATTPNDRMGLGEGTFKVNKPTELRSVLPNQVGEGDQFMAGFSVMNRTEKARTIKVVLTATGDVAKDSKTEITQDVTLEPYKRSVIYMPITVATLNASRNTQKGEISFQALAMDDLDKDGLKVKIPVSKTRVLETAANSSSFTDKQAKETIAFPKDIYTDIGDVSVTLSPSVIANLEGAFRYIESYPYNCWEQQLTKAVMAAHYQKLKSYVDTSFVWKGNDTLAQKILDAASNYQAPNGGMAYFVSTDEHADPYLSAYTALSFHWLKARGYAIPKDVETKLHTYLADLLKKDKVPSFYSAGMTSTVRAVALNALALEGKASQTDIERYRPALKQMSLFGKAQFMQAALHTKGSEKTANEAFKAILSAGIQSSGKFTFNEKYDDSYSRILATPMRDNCAILSAILSYKDKTGDIPMKMVRGITQTRKGRDYWENTQENVFCMNALADYASVYETEKPSMTVSTSLNGKEFGTTSFKELSDKPITLSRPLEDKDAGHSEPLTIDRQGEGRLYYTTRISYATKGAKDAVNAGIDLKREYSIQRNSKWELVKADETLKRGDVIRVDLYASLPTARNFVVVNDPLPGGLETINRDLATASSVDDNKAVFNAAGGSLWYKYDDWKEYNLTFWSFYHKELRHDSVRFYSDYLPPGNYHLSYAAQVIADGTFAVAPARAEEMYDPDVFGRSASQVLTVKTP